MDNQQKLNMAFAKYGDTDVKQDELDAFTKAQNIPAIDAGDYADYAFQRICDDKFKTLAPKLASALAKVAYICSSESDDDQKKQREANSDVVVELAKIIEEADLPLNMVDNVSNEVGKMFAGFLQMAVTTVHTRAKEAQEHIVKEKLGVRRVGTVAIRDFIQKVFDDAVAKKDEKKPEAK